MHLDLTGKVALITGATRLVGIGAAIARAFADAGADIAFTHWLPYDKEGFGTTSSEPEQLSRDLREKGVRVLPLESDLSDPATPARLFDRIEAELGPVSILVNNATVSINDDIETITAESLDRHYAVNTRGTILLSAEFTRRFSGDGGRIINMTSGQSHNPMPNEISYIATKGSIEAFTTSAAHGAAAAKGITINAIDPGVTDTGWMTDEFKAQVESEMKFGRVSTPEDAARLILFLASDAGRWITGQVIRSRGA